jgi:hypothetical protein
MSGNREPAPISDSQWTVAAIAADPRGAFQQMRQLLESRNAWHRKFDETEMRMRKKYGQRVREAEAERDRARAEAATCQSRAEAAEVRIAEMIGSTRGTP